MAFVSSGNLRLDLIRITIDQMGDAYKNLTPDAVKKIDVKAESMVTALTEWLKRQTFNITYMDAPVVIPSKYPFEPETGAELPQILIKPGAVKTIGPVSPTGGLLPGASNAIPIQMGLSLYGRAQLAKNPNDNLVGFPTVQQNVRTSEVKLLEAEY